MLLQRVNRTDAEKVFSIVQNVSGGTLSAGVPVAMYTTSPDGVKVSKPATNEFGLLVGLTAAAVADSGYVLAQVYGYNSAAYVSNNASTAITAGNYLGVANGAAYLVVGGASTAAIEAGVFALASYATNATPSLLTKAVFIKLL